ncbi:hypothetical protein [Brevundimonas sp. GCM10030266]|uniref:hypothetical protein n=1 Tax=Brevundimonas sp. GCM10030266 TaxID=3273386 RepID=UPI00361E162B
MRSEYVLTNLKELNSLISDVYVNVSAINHAVADGQPAPAESVQQTRDALAKLNWKAVETAAMLPRDQRGILRDFQAQALEVSKALDGDLDIAKCQLLLTRVNAMALGGAQAIQAVGKYVELAAHAAKPALESFLPRPSVGLEDAGLIQSA